MHGFLDVCPDGKALKYIRTKRENRYKTGVNPNSTPVDLTCIYATAIDFEMVKVFSITGPVTGCPESEGVDFALTRDCGTGSIFGSLGSSEF